MSEKSNRGNGTNLIMRVLSGYYLATILGFVERFESALVLHVVFLVCLKILFFDCPQFSVGSPRDPTMIV
mgnify:CR=1